MLCASSASAYTNGWYGWPCPTNASYYSVDTNHYFFQLYTALVERCMVAGKTTPTIIDTYTLAVGQTNYTFITNGNVITNSFFLTTSVSKTNQFLPFEYAWSNASGVGVSTCYPSIKRSWFTQWDSTLAACLSTFVMPNQLGTDGTYNAYFAAITNQGESAVPPVFTSTGLFSYAGIGFTVSNAAHWTDGLAIPTNADWLLASIHSTGASASVWGFKRWTDLTNAHPQQPLNAPVAQYFAASNQIPTNVIFTVYGTAWGSMGTNFVVTNETAVFLDASDVQLSNTWRTVTNIICTSTRPNSNDAIRLTYKILPPLYDSVIGWRLGPYSFNERKAAVDALKWTYSKTGCTYDWVVRYKSDPWMPAAGSGGGAGITYTNYSTTISGTEADYTYPQFLIPNSQMDSGTASAYYGPFMSFSPYYYGLMRNAGIWIATNNPPSSSLSFSHRADFYWIARAATWGGAGGITYKYETFNDLGTGLKENQYAFIGTNKWPVFGGSANSTNSAGTYGTNVITAWSFDPATNYPSPPGTPTIQTNTVTSMGYSTLYVYTYPGCAIMRWDVDITNGLKYVER